MTIETAKKVKLQVGRPTGKPVGNIGSFGINSCHAALWLRDDLPVHFKRLHDELGMTYVRCHGIFHDELGVVAPDGSFHFEKALAVLARILDNGQRPFLELSCMPGAFCRNDKFVCFYRFSSSPPKDWQMWGEFIRQFALTIERRFGVEEVRQWYFEVWNEPDLPFWDGTKEDYFHLYDITRAALKSVDSALRVGGPATSKTAWIDDFADHVSVPSASDPTAGIRCDFVSTHAYPSDLPFLDSAIGEVKMQSANILPEMFKRVREVVDVKLGRDIPVFLGEWNSSAGPYAFNHDECANAAFVVKTVMELSRYCVGSLYWNGSDIYEEGDFHYVPFHGGYGLINVNGIPKSSFYAFKFLREMSGTELAAKLLDAPPELGACAVCTATTKKILLWHYQDPDKKNDVPVRIKPEGGSCSWHCEQIKPHQGSAYETWLKLNSPTFVNRKLLTELERASVPAAFEICPDGYVTLAPGEIALLTEKTLWGYVLDESTHKV